MVLPLLVFGCLCCPPDLESVGYDRKPHFTSILRAEAYL